MRESIKNNSKAEDWISDLVGALTDPIICHGNELDAPPEKIRTAITLQRLIENMAAQRENRKPIGTDAEAAWYLSTASLAAPLPSEWVHIYMFVFNKTCRLNKTEVPSDLRQDTLDSHEMGLLTDLKEWIYKVRTEHRLVEAKDQRREQKETNRRQKEDLQPKMFQF